MTDNVIFELDKKQTKFVKLWSIGNQHSTFENHPLDNIIMIIISVVDCIGEFLFNM